MITSLRHYFANYTAAPLGVVAAVITVIFGFRLMEISPSVRDALHPHELSMHGSTVYITDSQQLGLTVGMITSAILIVGSVLYLLIKDRRERQFFK